METVLALFLFLLIVHSVMAVFWYSFLITQQMQQQAELQNSVRRARQYLSSDLAKSNLVQVKDAFGQNAATGPHLYLTSGADLLHYYQYEGQLFRDTATGSPLPLAEYIDSVSFSQQDPSTVLCRIVAAQDGSRLELWSNMKYNRYSAEVIEGYED